MTSLHKKLQGVKFKYKVKYYANVSVMVVMLITLATRPTTMTTIDVILGWFVKNHSSLKTMTGLETVIFVVIMSIVCGGAALICALLSSVLVGIVTRRPKLEMWRVLCGTVPESWYGKVEDAT